MVTGHEKNEARRGCVSSDHPAFRPQALTSDAVSNRKWGKVLFDCCRDPLHHSEESLFSSLVYVVRFAFAV